MAMPHAGVFAASRDPINGILQPQDLNVCPLMAMIGYDWGWWLTCLQGLGAYEITASVPSPITNVLCASMQEAELAPIVHSQWPSGNNTQMSVTSWPGGFDIPSWPHWLNQTSVDDLFEFGEKYGRRHPVFPKLPMPYNTVLNDTGWFADSIYLLAASAKGEYIMCSLKASLTTVCSTQCHKSVVGGSMRSLCEDDDVLAYRKTSKDATEGVIQKDWASVATEWAKSLGLKSGITDGASSNARLLTQLIPVSQALDPSLPSIAEALAVLSGCTLLMSSTDSPFKHFWSYSATGPTLKEPQYQGFQASLRFREYASGGTWRWQRIFYVVLFLTFAINVICLLYFLVRQGLVTDFIEPQNLFALSLNSPPSHSLDGACCGGPEGRQLALNWHIKMDHEREHFYIQSGEARSQSKRRTNRPLDFEMDTSSVVNAYTKLSNRHTPLL
ncbi:MAG: hypothetical protein Q9220_002671 [cf. Caloplaca sp. 1 TL-2023]